MRPGSQPIPARARARGLPVAQVGMARAAADAGTMIADAWMIAVTLGVAVLLVVLIATKN